MDLQLVWHRRDFRTEDNTALHEAARLGPLVPVFIIDRETIADFDPGQKPQAYFFGTLIAYRAELVAQGKDLILVEGNPRLEIPRLCRELGAAALHFGKDYEPATRSRDDAVAAACRTMGITVYTHKDHVLNEEREVLTATGTPFRVFTPYKEASRRRLDRQPPKPLPRPTRDRILDRAAIPKRLLDGGAPLWEKLESLTAVRVAQSPGETHARARLESFIESGLSSYSTHRNLPAAAGTSGLSADLRSGALSPRTIWDAVELSGAKRAERDTFLAELLWRDFFIAVGFCFPDVFNGPFNRRYEKITWRNDENEFTAWCEGRTGYPIVDAGMRELVQTGFMHNRVRMITAMFLVKDLLVDWRWGERFFRQHLIDGDLAVNNGNWQWSAGTGCDAQPYFRIFNPWEQTKKFDPDREYIRRWVPEIDTPKYPDPIVDHAVARLRCLTAYKRVV